MYCPIHNGLCPTMPPKKRIGLPLNCPPKKLVYPSIDALPPPAKK